MADEIDMEIEPFDTPQDGQDGDYTVVDVPSKDGAK